MDENDRAELARLAPWPTLGERDAGKLPEAELYEDVPPHLKNDLVRWVASVLSNEQELARRVLNRFRVSWIPNSQASSYASYPRSHQDAVIRIVSGNLAGIESPRPLDPLSVVDAVISLHPGWEDLDSDGYGRTWQDQWLEHLLALIDLLLDTGSAWHVDAELRGLYRRVDPTATEAWRQARELATSVGSTAAAANLETAWREVYGRRPNPSASYGAAVKAVEAVAVPLLNPGTGSTVHAAARKFRKELDQWRFTLLEKSDMDPGTGSADVVSAMLDRLLTGETGRHTSADHNRDSTQAESEAAVHLAVILVQWFTSGAVHRAQ
ncbi:hypothetical protein [Amycolatopsis sp. MtRt-6]|uniref:hypothetical protein n=1 Tax=Amycolatopsis sp. MtRt-6 TaxID=2792782 RepID=UPI001A8FB29E|nr:hypothetical protein [Amycolatopsis sp. MtRt-6]